jgi:hypothetical protein
MKKNALHLLTLSFVFVATVCADNGYAQTQSKLKVAVFAPLYLDSVFAKNLTYTGGKKFPRFTLPGFELCQGISAATSLFPIPDKNIELHVFDTKSDTTNIDEIIAREDFSTYHLMLASVKDQELDKLSIVSLQFQIPLISITYPNNAGITNNPFLVILNSTLQTHCEAIFSNILQNHASSNVVLVNQTGTQEERVSGYFNQINNQNTKKLIALHQQKIDSNFYLLKNALDSNKVNVIVGGSLDEEFATKLAVTLNPWKDKYKIQLFGMPNWESFKIFGNKNAGAKLNIPIHYTTSYFNERTDSISQFLQDYYLEKFKGIPTDMFFKGFEAMYVFSRLINQFPEGLTSIRSSNSLKLFSAFNILPKQFPLQQQPGYYENKHLFFIKKLNGKSTKGGNGGE